MKSGAFSFVYLPIFKLYFTQEKPFPPCAHNPHLNAHPSAEVIAMSETKQKPRRRRAYPEKTERPVPSEVYPVIDNDLARDNIENDLPAADLNEL